MQKKRIALHPKKRIVILGGGFSGVYTAMHLEKLMGKQDDYEIVLVNKDNYFIYQPMLAEVVGGSLSLFDTVSPLKRLLPKTTLFIRDIYSIDIPSKTVTLSPKFSHSTHTISYDHLVLALGNVTDFKGIPGIHEHALPFKSLADAVAIRNRIIEVLEAAASEDDLEEKKALLSFVIGGGGFSGVEVGAEVNDFARKLAKAYPSIDPSMIRVVLAHKQHRLMERELSESLSAYSAKILRKRGVEIRFQQCLTSASPNEAVLDGKEMIPAKTIISTVPSSPNPLIATLPFALSHGKIKTDSHLLVEGCQDVWAIGDCASVPVEESVAPPTAQFAIREAKTLASNIAATIRGKKLSSFHFKTIGMLGALGHQCAVAEFFGKIKISGFFAWLMWRAIYWMKLPGIDRKLKVMFSWLLDMIIPIESVQLQMTSSQGITHLHYQKGETIFHEGDLGDYLYIIVRGDIEVLKQMNGVNTRIATLSAGEYFGEMALLNETRRIATTKCLSEVDVLALKKQDFGALLANLPELKHGFERTNHERAEMLKSLNASKQGDSKTA